MKFRIFIIASLFPLFAPGQTKDPQVITWMRWDDPPIFILQGPYQGQGLLDITEKIITKKLPQYSHDSLVSTVQRVLVEAEKGTHACNAGWLDTPEWHKLFYFSKPVFVIPSNGILLKKSKLEEIQSLEPYSLQKFLNKKQIWKLGVGRLYGVGIDEVLVKNQYQKNPKIITISTSLKVHQMLQSDRIQYTLGYPFEAVYYNEYLNAKDRVVHLPLTDNKPIVDVVVACPRNEWGKSVIDQVNKVLKNNPEILDEIRKGVDRWLTSEDQKRLEKPRKEMRENY
ncbi:TIGR02285 family protein [Bdellovibrio sp. HCB185ZH]|uniref:TIGR02285 family protein n=1 Tax=Bdellovibrio sp. HCB185ZH TaxID=3394235 RepID=UPI0039A4A33F